MANRQHGKHVIPERKETNKATRRVVLAPSRPWHREQALVESSSLPELRRQGLLRICRAARSEHQRSAEGSPLSLQ